MLSANENANPQTSDVKPKNSIVGEDNAGKMIGLPENQGGVSQATMDIESLSGYVKKRLLIQDRRFARDPLFLFFMLDLIEKKNIAAVNRFVVSTKCRNNLTQGDVVNPVTSKMNKNIVSTVPSQIRSSYAYKRKNFLDLQCIFENLGALQLFLIFACDDKSEDFKGILSDGIWFPWEDPFLFSLHFKRKWLRFFIYYVCKHFARQIGGIKEHSWVMEIQDRRSLNIHMVLWTNKSVQELIAMNAVHTWFPEGSSINDPLMRDLVNRLQLYKCNDNYRKRESRCTYKRDVGDTYVNNYNPYLLAVFRTSMDIQYDDGPQTVRYLAKYLAKDDYEAKILLKNILVQNQGYYKRTTYVSEREHCSTRVVGGVEATYDTIGWRKHSNSRKVIFLNTDDTQIFSLTPVEIYEKRDGAAELTMPQFFCFYKRVYKNLRSVTVRDVTRLFYPQSLPERINIESVEDIVDVERGLDVCREELNLMFNMANQSQKSIFSQIITELELNSTAIVSGATGTGKSYVLRMLERHYKPQQYKVFKLAPTGVAAHNVSGQTIHRFFGLTNVSSVPNFLILDEYAKLYSKIMLLIDEYFMISAKLLESINDALVKTTQRATIMGGVKAVFFGDAAQLLPIQQKEGKVWESEIFNAVLRYSLHDLVRQQDESFMETLNKVRNYQFDESVVAFINERSVHKPQLPLSCLRLYTTRQRVASANEKGYVQFPGAGTEFQAHDSYIDNQRTAKIALRETRLLECLFIKPNMPVMLIHNLHVPTGWVNGTIALVEYMEEENVCLKKRLPNGDDAIYWIQRISRQVPGTSYTRTQFPIVPDLPLRSTKCKAQQLIVWESIWII
ncbi:hypothetical protein G6F55_003251 [Rhizopus delemar]|nr:hypothetical protein G6F55_003251 [Rhizopus delemar]